MPSVSVLAQGTDIEISTTEQTDVASNLALYTSLNCITKEIQYQGGTATEIDTTTLCSTAREFRIGLQDPGTMTINGHWAQGDAGHEALRAAAEASTTRLIRITFPDGSTFKAIALVRQRSFTVPTDGVVTATYSLRLTGGTLETLAPPPPPPPPGP